MWTLFSAAHADCTPGPEDAALEARLVPWGPVLARLEPPAGPRVDPTALHAAAVAIPGFLRVDCSGSPCVVGFTGTDDAAGIEAALRDALPGVHTASSSGGGHVATAVFGGEVPRAVAIAGLVRASRLSAAWRRGEPAVPDGVSGGRPPGSCAAALAARLENLERVWGAPAEPPPTWNPVGRAEELERALTGWKALRPTAIEVGCERYPCVALITVEEVRPGVLAALPDRLALASDRVWSVDREGPDLLVVVDLPRVASVQGRFGRTWGELQAALHGASAPAP